MCRPGNVGKKCGRTVRQFEERVQARCDAPALAPQVTCFCQLGATGVSPVQMPEHGQDARGTREFK
jgi:hypothetical protein